MTLMRQLTLYLTALLFLLLSGILIMNINDARSYLQDQLESHAQDTATSLGVAISATHEDDLPVVDALIDAVFDRGYYRVIRFTNPEGEVLVNSEHSVQMDDVLAWFISLVRLEAPKVSTEVSRNWLFAGTLLVISHPGYAYRSLWNKTVNGVLLFGGALLLAILGLNLFLSIVLGPLKRLEKQANAICQRSFEQQTKLPKTRDLRRVVEAINRMAGKLEALFDEKVVLTEELRRQSVQDPLTGLLNRRAFDDRASGSLQNQERGDSGGGLVLVQVSKLDDFNRQYGRNAADLLLVDVAHRIGKSMEPWPESFVGRRGGSEFSVFIPACDYEQGQQIADNLFRALASLPFFMSDQGLDRLHVAMITHVGRISLQDMLQQVDQLLRNIQKQSGNSWMVRQVDQEGEQDYRHWSEGHWYDSLNQVLKRQEVELFAQTAYSIEGEPLFREVFARLHLLGELTSAEAFLPMVERFDLHADFDKLVVKVLLAQMRKQDSNQRFCVNLLPRSLLDESFYGWLLDTLKATPELTSRIILEVPERTLLLAGDRFGGIIQNLLQTGCRFSVDHFGIASRVISTLHGLNLDYIKVDGSFIQNIHDNQGNQFYIRTLAMLTRNRDITLLAQDVETEADWQELQELGVQGGQGFYLGRPERL